MTEQVMESANKKAYRDKNKDKIYARVKAWRLKYPHRVLTNGARQRAIKRGLEFNIEAVDVEIPKTCPILDIPIIKHICVDVRSGPHNNSPSIDRIDNTKGYIKGNIQVISHKANTMKANATPDELIKFAKWILRTYETIL